MKVIGLTGSVGMGKSVTAGLFKSLRIPVFDSDACVHHLLAHDRDTIEAVLGLFPAARHGSGGIDRKRLGAVVFSSPDARALLESVLHPRVRDAQRLFLAAQRRAGRRRVVLDIPLLFETGAERRCDEVWCVTAPAFLQKRRVLARNGMTPEKFDAILKAQIPDRDKRHRADVVLPTGGGRALTLRRLKKSLG